MSMNALQAPARVAIHMSTRSLTRSLAKPKKTRSRTGCVTCKKRKVKCDEKSPACGQCAAKELQCHYIRNCHMIQSPEGPENHSAELEKCHKMGIGAERAFVPDSPDRVLPPRDSDDSLVNTFCEQMTRNIIRSVDIPGNPHLDVFKPLIRQSQTVLCAVQALAALHNVSAICTGENSGAISKARTDALEYQGKAIRFLNRDLQNKKLVHTDAVLASTLLLYIFEQAFDADNRDHLSYLEGARTLIHQRFFLQKSLLVNTHHEITWATRILVKLFVWHDKMRIMTKPWLASSTSFTNLLRLTDMLNKKSENNLYLLGWAKDINWLMNDLVIFTRDLLKATKDKEDDATVLLQMLPRAAGIEKKLQSYKPTIESVKYFMGNIEVAEENLHQCLATIELYREVSLLYLYQVMPDLLPTFMVDNFAHDLLQQLCAIPKDSSMIAYHGWILITIGAQCLTTEDRETVLERLKYSHDRFRFPSIATNSTKLVLEVWRRRDELEKDSICYSRAGKGHWTDVLKDIGENLAYV